MIGPNRLKKCSLVVLLVVLLLQCATSHYYLGTKHCGSFYSEEDSRGQNISFFDTDQSISLHYDERSPSGSWPETKSISIQNSCSMQVCNETYFDGTCITLPSGEHSFQDINITDIASASCTCEKECKCEDIYMRKSTCARAYLEGGCRSCDALYIDLEFHDNSDNSSEDRPFPTHYTERVQALRLRKGCNLTISSYADSNSTDLETETITSETVEDFQGLIESYRCECDDDLFVPKPTPTRPDTYPPLVDIPPSMDEVIKMLMDEKNSNHPGLRAAHQSLKSGRSSKNAYILLLGSTGSGKSTTINVLFANPNVTRHGGQKSTTTDIHEFRIPIAIDELGVANSELRVIDTPGLGDTRGMGQDAMFLATLDDYLSSHEELKHRIPNVVFIFHKFNDNRFSGKGSAFVQMLRGLDSFRTKITDENYSNVIFVFSHFCSETNKIKKRPEVKLAQFQDVIEDFSQFPKPTFMALAENKPIEYGLSMINGYAKLPNNEYYPRNLFEKLELVSRKGGDPIGLGVFRTAFRDSESFNVTGSTYKLLPNHNDKVAHYLAILSNAFIGVMNTEISKELRRVWEENVDPELKRKFPDSLLHLQKALSLKNIHKLEDVPKTPNAVLELVTSVKQDEATRILMEKALGFKAPEFPSNTIAGLGYNVFKDTYLPTSPFVLGDLEPSDIGFMIPKSLSVKLDQETREHFHIFQNKNDYIQYRLKDLGIDGNVSLNAFTGNVKPGHNIKSTAFKNDSCSISATREIHLFEFKLNDRLQLTDEFIKAVKNLPYFDQSNHESVEIWNKFFNDYGTHVVSSVYGGGSIEIELKSNKPDEGRISRALFDLINFAEEMSFLITVDGTGNNTGRGVISEGINHYLKFSGGDRAFYTTDLTQMSMEKAAKLLTNWKKSLKFNPSVLTTEMKLLPMGQVVKTLGEYYSSEIERATSLLFESSLKYVPPARNPVSQPGPSRDQTPSMNTFMQQMSANNAVMQQLIAEMSRMEAERQMRHQEMEKMRLDNEIEERRRVREIEEKRRIAQENHDKEKLLHERELAENERAGTLEREFRQAKYQQELLKLQNEMSIRNNRLVETFANFSFQQQSGGCLKAGTKILMADRSEKNVEDLKVGDVLLDMELHPTRLTGINYQYLLDSSFYGFDDQSYFFTGEHMFVGPAGQSNGKQFYVQSMERLLEHNPLMKYWNVKEMGESLNMFYYEKTLNSVESSSVSVFKDKKTYPLDTPIYFIQVDSPSGTYFANGYVCKVDVPPVEHWPNTMSLLFNLMKSPSFEELSSHPFSLETVALIDSMVSRLIKEKMSNYGPEYLEDERGTEVMTLENSMVDECLNKIFNEPTTALLAIKMYSKWGPVISNALDNVNEQIGAEYVAKVQHSVYKFLSSRLGDYLDSNGI